MNQKTLTIAGIIAIIVILGAAGYLIAAQQQANMEPTEAIGVQEPPPVSTDTPPMPQTPTPTPTKPLPIPPPAPPPSPPGDGDGQICIQVITPARNPATGECREFPTPCDVPAGWQKVSSCRTY